MECPTVPQQGGRPTKIPKTIKIQTASVSANANGSRCNKI